MPIADATARTHPAPSRGPVHTAESTHAHLTGIGVTDVTLTGGLWSDRCAANREHGIVALGDRLEEHGVVENFRRLVDPTLGSREDLWYTDSDLYKWLEAAAWSLGTHPGAALEERVDRVIDAVVAAQASDG